MTDGSPPHELPRAPPHAPLQPRALATLAHTCPPPATSAPPRAPPGRRTPSRPNNRPPATAGHPRRADPLRPTTHRRGARSTVSFSLLQPLNRAPPLVGLLLDLFPHRPHRRLAGNLAGAATPCHGGHLPCFARGMVAQPRLGRLEAAQVHSNFS
jgi:hypothetical protein